MRDEPEAPLVEDASPLGDAVRAYRDAAREASESGAWRRLEARLEGGDARAEDARMRRATGVLGLSLAAAAVAVVAIVSPERFLPRGNLPSAQVPVQTVDAGILHVSPSIDVLPDREATARVDGRVVRLEHGRVEVRSHEASPLARVRIIAEPYAFDDIGTIFTVDKEAAFVDLAVREGRVLVTAAGVTIATIEAGGSWRGRVGETPRAPVVPAEAEAPKQLPVTVIDAGAPRATVCRAMPADRALACYAALARGTDLTAQTALYELANLRRDRGDNGGALEDYRAYQTRFPGGPLATEAKLSEIELLAKTGRAAAALERSAALLAAQPHLERASELHLLRGNLYREGLNDLPKAAAEYEVASRDSSATGAEALFLRGACAEGLNDVDGARAAYEAYVARGTMPREAEAKKRIDALSALKK